VDGSSQVAERPLLGLSLYHPDIRPDANIKAPAAQRNFWMMERSRDGSNGFPRVDRLAPECDNFTARVTETHRVLLALPWKQCKMCLSIDGLMARCFVFSDSLERFSSLLVCGKRKGNIVPALN
jgi:hypothetical protein